ncbi:hypothetical protein [Brevibacterium aurantiacum]|uniref:hypothetical protein n=1 Tax=Brevibacterium aurantiacum TaxID=273384 RepID=UPI00356B69C3
MNFFTFIAEEVRGYLAQLGLRSLDEAIGAVELFCIDADRAAASGLDLDLTPILTVPTDLDGAPASARVSQTRTPRDFAGELDVRLLKPVSAALGEPRGASEPQVTPCWWLLQQQECPNYSTPTHEVSSYLRLATHAWGAGMGRHTTAKRQAKRKRQAVKPQSEQK